MARLRYGVLGEACTRDRNHGNHVVGLGHVFKSRGVSTPLIVCLHDKLKFRREKHGEQLISLSDSLAGDLLLGAQFSVRNRVF